MPKHVISSFLLFGLVYFVMKWTQNFLIVPMVQSLQKQLLIGPKNGRSTKHEEDFEGCQIWNIYAIYLAGYTEKKRFFFIFEYIEEKIRRGTILQLRNKLEY